jgi:1-deoxy-D-xylulose-5-phosphate reductoisomerase
LNAANEAAVEAFVEGRIAFTEIWQLVRRALENCSNLARPLLDDIVRADLQAREFVREAIATR